MLFILGISVTTVPTDETLDSMPALCVSNHQSYLDIIIFASLRPISFVAKKEVQGWVLLGWMARLGGTIFIDRDSLRGGVSAVRTLTTQLQQNLSVHIFPESTSTNGSCILPFKPMLFTSALEARTAILPMTIRYRSIDRVEVSPANRDIVCWHGTMEFLPHFFRLIRTRSITAEVIHHPLIHPSPCDTARTLAERSFTAVASA
ncbi:MAG: lysophospholipid acyltransferase family protein [Bacteroidota bacterium]